MILEKRGTQPLSIEELRDVAMPEATETYIPVNYYDSTAMVKEMAANAVSTWDYKLVNEEYVIARQGQRMFGLLSFQNSLPMKFTVGFANSYDKSCRFKIATGSQVWVCSNLMISGEVVEMRKHTKNVHRDLEDVIRRAVQGGREQHIKGHNDAQTLRWSKCDNRDAFEIMGVAYGQGIVTVRQLPAIKKGWLEPQHDEFKPRTQWSLYNSFTEAMKTTPPNKILDGFYKLHQLFMN